MNAIKRVWAYASRHKHVKDSLDVIEKSLTAHNFDYDKFCVGFNGGKDCTVLLHLIYTVLVKHQGNGDEKLKAYYVKGADTFPELAEFVELSVTRYGLDLIAVEETDYKKALEVFKNSEVGKSVDTIFMGTRASDNATSLQVEQRTDPGWPEFLRFSPILHWSYREVWSFLRDLQIPYCSLYDKGYTSLGAQSKTFVNPKLKVVTPEGETIYLPAYALQDPDAERSGRSN